MVMEPLSTIVPCDTGLNSMEQSPSGERNRFSASKEIPRILVKPKVYYRVNKSPPRDPIRSQINPVHSSIPFSRDPF
jgi:hypothetical protein